MKGMTRIAPCASSQRESDGLTVGGEPMTLILPVTLAASCAFMLPVATPPNAIVFSSGYISIAQMARAGFALNIVSVLLVTAIAVWLAPLVF